MIYTREILHSRHRLSHQQIDSWLGENRSKEFMPEKLKSFEAVKNFLFVTDLLRQNGISFISFKGPLLSQRIYGDPTIRLSHDMDLLVEIADIDPVKNILVEQGYHLSVGSSWPHHKAQQELIMDVNHHISFFNESSGSCVEIHWILMHGFPISVKKQKEIIAGNLTEMDFAGRKFTVFTKEFELLFLLIHGSRHGWQRLKWLLDIKNYPVADMNYDVFNQLARQFDAGRVIGLTNYLLHQFFKTTLPFTSDARLPGYLIRFAQQSIDGEIRSEPFIRDYLHSYRNLWLMFSSFKYKYLIITGTFIRPGDFQLINSSFKIVYYLYRPYSLLKRRLVHAR